MRPARTYPMRGHFEEPQDVTRATPDGQAVARRQYDIELARLCPARQVDLLPFERASVAAFDRIDADRRELARHCGPAHQRHDPVARVLRHEGLRNLALHPRDALSPRPNR